MPTIAAIILTLGLILAIKVGVAFAQAEDDEAKKKAKGQLINIAIGFIVALLIVGVITAVLNAEVIKGLFVSTLEGAGSLSWDPLPTPGGGPGAIIHP